MSESASTPAYPALVIDGSSSCFFSGVLEKDGSWLAYKKAPEPALESLFKTVDIVLEEAGLELDRIQSFFYCEGPGSVLGLRLCAMAIETWRRIHPGPTELYAYNSLKLVAACLQNAGRVKEESLLISDWKKDTWNSLKISPTTLGVVAPISATELSGWQGPLYHLPARKGWQDPPENALELAYEPEKLASLTEVPELILRSQAVTLYNSGINSFQKWTPDRHRATPERHGGEPRSKTQ